MSDPTALPNVSGGSNGAAPNQPGAVPVVDEGPLRDRVVAALEALGSPTEIDSDGDVTFEFQDQRLFVRCGEDDSQVLRVFGQWQLQEPVPADHLTRLEVCNDVNVAFNLVKAAIANDTLLVTSEHMLPRGADVQGLLSIAVPLTLHAVQLWHERATGESVIEPADADQAPGEAPAGEQA